MWGWVLGVGLVYLFLTRQQQQQVVGAQLAGLSVADTSGIYGGATADDTGAPTSDFLDPTSGGLILGPSPVSILGAGPIPGNLQPGESVAMPQPGAGGCR